MLRIAHGPEGVVVLAGRLDAAQSPAADAFLSKVQGNVTLDCTGLEYVSSAGLGVILKTQKRLLGSGGKLRMAQVNRHVMELLSYAGFDQILEIQAAT